MWMTKIILMVVTVLHRITTSSGSYNCIGRCSCSIRDDLLIADCSSLNLTNIPIPTQYQVKVLLFPFNHITRLKRDSFLMFTSIQKLDLSQNRIRFIEHGAFTGLNSSGLDMLDLSHNSLRGLPLDELHLISSSLLHLSLAYNAFRQLPDLSKMKNLQRFDISQNSLITSLPEKPLPASLLELNLAFTSIRSFKRIVFSNSTLLRKLFLSDNFASGSVDFQRGIFDDLTSLEYLDLSHCYCRSLTPRSFVKLQHLKTLLLKSSSIKVFPVFRVNALVYNDTLPPEGSGDDDSMPLLPNSFNATVHNSTQIQLDKRWAHPNLSRVDLSGNRNLVLPTLSFPIFPPSLTWLDLSYTKVQTVRKVTFSNLRKLQSFNLCNSRISLIEEEALMSFPKLYEVCLSGNRFIRSPQLPASVQRINMTNSKVKNLTVSCIGRLGLLRVADWSGGELCNIQDFAFSNMTLLRSLNLSTNRLRYVNERTLLIGDVERVSSLKSLDLSGNGLTVTDGPVFIALRNLKLLLLQNNEMEEISEMTLQGLGRLKKLNLANNEIVAIAPRAFRGLRNLEELYLDNNNIEDLYNHSFSPLTRLKTLTLSNNQLIIFHTQTLPSLTGLNIMGNNLTSFPFLKAPLLRKIHAMANHLKEVTYENLMGIPNLEHLDLHDNRQLRDINFIAFRATPHLKSLNLGSCDIVRFANFTIPSLKVLYLHENHISEISRPIDEVIPQVVELDLSYNDISSLDTTIFNKSTALHSLDLSGNNFDCDCHLKSLVTWLVTQKEHETIDVIGLDSYACETPKEVYTQPVVEVVEQLSCPKPTPTPQPKSSHDTSDQVLVIVLITALLMTALIGFLVYYVYRRHHADDDSSQTCSGFYCVRLYSRRSMRGQRAEFDDESRDLMVSSPITTPMNADAPEIL